MTAGLSFVYGSCCGAPSTVEFPVRAKPMCRGFSERQLSFVAIDAVHQGYVIDAPGGESFGG